MLNGFFDNNLSYRKCRDLHFLLTKYSFLQLELFNCSPILRSKYLKRSGGLCNGIRGEVRIIFELKAITFYTLFSSLGNIKSIVG